MLHNFNNRMFAGKIGNDCAFRLGKKWKDKKMSCYMYFQVKFT